MWTGNNVTRPFRIAGAAALAPALDEGLKRLQKALRLPLQFVAFLLVAVSFASICFSIVGSPESSSRLGKVRQGICPGKYLSQFGMEPEASACWLCPWFVILP